MGILKDFIMTGNIKTNEQLETAVKQQRCNFCGNSPAKRSVYEGQFLCDACSSVWHQATAPVSPHYHWRIMRPDGVGFKGFYSEQFMTAHYGRMGWRYERIEGDDNEQRN